MSFFSSELTWVWKINTKYKFNLLGSINENFHYYVHKIWPALCIIQTCFITLTEIVRKGELKGIIGIFAIRLIADEVNYGFCQQNIWP